MTIFWQTLHRVLKNKIQITLLIFWPIFTMCIPLLDSMEHPLRVGVVDEDGTAYTQALQQQLAAQAEVVPLQASSFQQSLYDQRVEYVLVLEKGLSQQVAAGDSVKVKGYSFEESNAAKPIEMYVNHLIEQGTEQKGALPTTVLGEHRRDLSRSMIGIVVLFTLYSSGFAATRLIADRQSEVLQRTMAAPVTVARYMVETTSAFLVVAFLQVTMQFLVLKYGFGVYLGESEAALYLLLLAFSVVAVSLGVSICVFTKTGVQAIVTGVLIVLSLSFMGGVYWPVDQNPPLTQRIARFDPVSWVMNGVDKILHGAPLSSLLGEFGMIGLFAVTFFLLGTLRKIDVQK